MKAQGQYLKMLMLVVVLSAAKLCFAQDPTFSLYNLNQYYFNPGATGGDGGYHVVATYRTLWPNVPGKIFPGPLSTSYAAFDAYMGRGNYSAGAGAFAMTDVEGEGFLTTSTFGVSYAQHFNKIGGSKYDALPRIQLSLGFKAYLNSISVNWDKLVYSDQLNIDEGIIGQSGTGQTGIGHKFTGDLDAGLLLKNNYNGKDNWYNEVGFAMGHILSPSESLSGVNTTDSRIPRKYLATYRSMFKLPGKHVYIGPTILFEKQNNFYEFNSGVDIFFRPNLSSAVIPVGFSLLNRLSMGQVNLNTNAIIVGINHKGIMGKNPQAVYTLGFGVDLPYSGLNFRSGGAYELSLAVVIPNKKGNGFSQCPYSTFAPIQ